MPLPAARDIHLRTRSWGTSRRYLAATALVATAAAIRWALGPWMAGANYFLFLLAIALSALFFERGSSIWAIALSAPIIVFFFVPPPLSFRLTAEDTVALLVFLAASFVLAVVGEVTRTLADQLQASEREKDVLYRELHHRTRNNLQVIGTTIAAEMHKTSDPAARNSLQAVADRITSIARVDQLLFRPGAGEVVDACDYLEQLADDIAASLVGQRPIIVICAAERLSIGREMAETLGIAVNELATNAIKHAFPDNRPGHLEIRFRQEEGSYVLVVDDNGRGCPAQATSGTGWQLLRSLIGRHRGKMEILDAAPGCRALIRLPFA